MINESSSRSEAFEKGDAVFATTTIVNDGSVPGYPENQVFAEPGTMGMLVNSGHLEEDPNQTVYLVGFTDTQGKIALVTCMPDEIAAKPIVAD